MSTKHTPGPWRLDIRSGCAGIKSSEPDDSPGMGSDYPGNLLLFTRRGATFGGEHGHWSLPEETIANVTLAAAAPDLLEALERASRKLSAYVGVCAGDKELTDTVLPMVRAALAKAKGEE